MLKIDEAAIDHMEAQHPGIREQIAQFEAVELPPCTECGSTDTAAVHVGIVGRTIYIAAATSKFTMVFNGPRPANYRCNTCRAYFD